MAFSKFVQIHQNYPVEAFGFIGAWEVMIISILIITTSIATILTIIMIIRIPTLRLKCTVLFNYTGDQAFGKL